MPTEKLDLGKSPHFEVTCNANLEVRGRDSQETRIEASVDPLPITPTPEGVIIESSSNCSIRMPLNGSLHVKQVQGNLRIKDVAGGAEVVTALGACNVRRVSRFVIEDAFSELNIREIQYDAHAARVKGCLIVRDVAGRLTAETVHGDCLGRDIPGGFDIKEVFGNLAIRTGFNPETHSRLGRVLGDVTFRIPADASVKFVIGNNIPVRLARSMSATEEEEQQVVLVGDGAATVIIEQATSVTIKQSSGYDDDASFAYSFAAGSEISGHLADISAELETQSEMLEGHLSATSERVRRHVSRSLDNARRQVENAQRRVQQEMDRVEGTARRVSISMDVDSSPSREPVSEQERLAVLKMLEDGNISVEEAQELLAALDGEK